MLRAFLFGEPGYERVILDTKQEAKRTQQVYEQEIGFRRTGITEKAIDYELKRDSYLDDAS
jgi:RimJ/RimL family protein N-acetyltransferase